MPLIKKVGRMVEHSPKHSKFKGLSLAYAAGTRRGEVEKKVARW
jgi:hypothetical protein